MELTLEQVLRAVNFPENADFNTEDYYVLAKETDTDVKTSVQLEIDSEIFCYNFGYNVSEWSLDKEELICLNNAEPNEDEDEDSVKHRIELYNEIKDTSEFEMVINGEAKYLDLYRDVF